MTSSKRASPVSPDTAPAAAKLACLFLALLFIAGCAEKSRAPVLPVQPGRDAPDQESWDATITFTDSGRVTAVLKAGYIAKYLQDRFTILDSGIVVDFFNEEHEHTSVLTARRGRVNDVTNDFEARGDVVVRSDSGTVLRSEALDWSNKREKVFTDGFVEIISPTEEIRGIGLESDKSLKQYTIRQVTGRAQQQ
jgi:LPS export ABC transporter protein LptC